jgi:hypothetical protein
MYVISFISSFCILLANYRSQVDYTNAAAVKVLAVGSQTNILKQLGMTSDEYNWVQSIYFVCTSQ